LLCPEQSFEAAWFNPDEWEDGDGTDTKLETLSDDEI